MTNKQPGDQISPEEQKQLEALSTSRVKLGEGVDEQDYVFHWAKNASKELREAGCLYEYARESWKLRCLLVLMTPNRKREAFEIVPLSAIGKSYNLSCSFEGLREEDVRSTLHGAVRWLTEFAAELADNKSFADLLRSNRNKVNQTLAKHPLDFPRLRAVQLAYPFPFDLGPPPWPWRPWSWDPQSRIPVRPSYEGGSEKIAIHIRWEDFNNREIGEAMRKFARANRPARRRRQPQQTSIHARLKALSALRIWKCERNQWKRLKLVAKICGYKGCVTEWAAYKKRCKEGLADEPMSKGAKSEMSQARRDALKFFQSLSPGERPSNS